MTRELQAVVVAKRVTAVVPTVGFDVVAIDVASPVGADPIVVLIDDEKTNAIASIANPTANILFIIVFTLFKLNLIL